MYKNIIFFLSFEPAREEEESAHALLLLLISKILKKQLCIDFVRCSQNENILKPS